MAGQRRPERRLDGGDVLPTGWRGPWDDYAILHGGSLSPKTLANYLDSFLQLSRFVGDAAPNLEDLTPRMVAAFLEHTAKTTSTVTAGMRYRGLRAVFNALAKPDEDGERLLEKNPMAGIRPPKVIEPPLAVLSIEDIKRVLATVRKGHRVEDIRDAAMITVLFTTGVRRGELASMKVDPQSLNLKEGVVAVNGKTGPRYVALDADTVKAVFRWMRARRHLQVASQTDALWVGHRGALTPNGIFQAIQQRFEDAGVEARHALHIFRHTWAHQYRLNGGNDSDLITSGGWSGPTQILRYGRSASQARAHIANRKMGLGKLLR
jgi:integrase/recombinase XerC